MTFNFPETIFVKKNTPLEQLSHVLSEAEEVRKELKASTGNLSLIDLEMMDLLHSCETYFRIRQGVRGEQFIQELVAKVQEKNAVRFYYVAAAE